MVDREDDRKRRGRATLEGDLAATTLRALRDTYREVNRTLFGDRLVQPALGLGDSGTRYGRWDPTLRSIEISSELLLARGWGSMIEVLKHEMAHQFVHEVLSGVDEPPHGAAFQRVCRERGIDSRATGEPGSGDASHPILDRIRKLLALAESSNEHEAQSAARAAQRLMLRHNVDQLTALRRDGYTHRQLGRTTGRVSEAEYLLGSILQEHFFVDVIWVHGFRPLVGKYGRVMEVCGRVENVELADYVREFLNQTSERLWREHKIAASVGSDRDRRTYLAGVMSGFADQLEKEKNRQVGSGLIWLGDPGLDQYFKHRHPAMSMRSYGERVANPARDHGRRAGREIVLHRGLRAKQTAGQPKLLGSGAAELGRVGGPR